MKDRRVGKRTQHKVRDGKYYIPPALAKQMDALTRRRSGLHELLSLLADELAALQQATRAWWRNVADELDVVIDGEHVWLYNHAAGYIARRDSPKQSPSTLPAEKGAAP